MDAIKELVDLVKTLPDIAVWLFVLFFAYKVAIVGSIYGVIRYVVGRICEVAEKRLSRPPAEPVTRLHCNDITKRCDLLELTDSELVDFFNMIKNANPLDTYQSLYTKRRDLDYVRQAFIEKRQRDMSSVEEKEKKS